MRLFQAPLDTCLGSPFFASLSVHGLHLTVYTAWIFISCHYLIELGPRQMGLPVADEGVLDMVTVKVAQMIIWLGLPLLLHLSDLGGLFFFEQHAHSVFHGPCRRTIPKRCCQLIGFVCWAPRPLANYLSKDEQGQDKPKHIKQIAVRRFHKRIL